MPKLKLLQDKLPYDEISFIIKDNQFKVVFIYKGKPVAELAHEYQPHASVHLTNLEGFIKLS